MRSLLKWGAFVFVIMLVVLLAAPFFIPKHYYIEWAVGAIEARLPVKLSVADAELRLLPTPHLALKHVDIKLQQKDGSYADLLQAETLDMATALDFDVRRIGTLENLERLEILRAKLFYPPGQNNIKPVVIERLVIDNIDLTPKTFHGDIDMSGQHGPLTLIGDLSVDIRHERQQDSIQGQVRLHSKQLTVLYAKDVAIRGQPFSLQTDFSYKADQARLRNTRLQLGPQGVVLTGDRDQDGIRFDFQAHPAHVDFLKTIIPALAVVPEVEGVNADGQLIIPTAKGKAVHVEGKVTADALKLSGYSLSKVSTDLSYGARKLQFSQVRAKLMEGNIAGDAVLNFLKPLTTYNVNLAVKALAVEQIGDVGESLSGRGYLDLKGQGKGFAKQDLEKYLSGAGNLEIKELKLKKLKFFRPLMSLQQWTGLSLVTGLINKAAFNRAKNLDEEAQNLTAQFAIGEGAIDFSSIQVNYPDANVALKGKIGFDESLDFAGTVNMSGGLVSSLFDAVSAKKAAASDKGLSSIPIKVTGTTQDPDVGIDSNFMTGKLAGIAALPLRVIGGILTLPLRLLTPRSHQKAAPDQTGSGEAGQGEESPQQETSAEQPVESGSMENSQPEPKKSRSIGPAAGGRRQR